MSSVIFPGVVVSRKIQSYYSLGLWIAAAALFLLTPPVVTAFDGQRQGFVLGFGLGYAPIVDISAPGYGFEESQSGLATDLLAGYGWNNHDILLLSDEGSALSTDKTGNDVSIHVIGSLKWNHYFGLEKHPFFTSVGVGVISFGTRYFDVDGSGFGYTLGVGKEIFKQVQIGVQYYGGHTTNSYGVSANHSAVNFLVTVMAY